MVFPNPIGKGSPAAAINATRTKEAKTIASKKNGKTIAWPKVAKYDQFLYYTKTAKRNIEQLTISALSRPRALDPIARIVFGKLDFTALWRGTLHGVMTVKP